MKNFQFSSILKGASGNTQPSILSPGGIPGCYSLKVSITTLLLLFFLFFSRSTLIAQFSDGDVITLQSDIGNLMAICFKCQNGPVFNTITNHAPATSNALPGYVQFTVKTMPGGKIGLRADNGNYLARCQGCIPGAPANMLTAHVSYPDQSYSQFTPIRHPSGKYSFKSDIGMYFARCRNCSPGASTSDVVAIHESNMNAAYAQWSVTIVKSNTSTPGSAGVLMSDGQTIYPASQNAPEKLTWDEAKAYCASLTEGGYQWRLPDFEELTELWKNRGRIGGFNEAGQNDGRNSLKTVEHFWSASPLGGTRQIRILMVLDGSSYAVDPYYPSYDLHKFRCRCIRE